MTHEDVFDEHGVQGSPSLDDDIESFDREESIDFRLEVALRKISEHSTCSEIPLSREQIAWERAVAPPDSESRGFAGSFPELFLSDNDGDERQLQRQQADMEDEREREPSDMELCQMKDYSMSSVSTDYQQLDAPPCSIVDISNPSSAGRRSPYCIIRSSHSATAAAAAATAAMIINDEPRFGLSLPCASVLTSTPPASPSLMKRPRMSEGCLAEEKTSTNVLSSDDEDSRVPTANSDSVAPTRDSPKEGRAMETQVAGKLVQESLTTRKCDDSREVPARSVAKETSVLHGGTGKGHAAACTMVSTLERARQCRAEALVRFRRKKAIRCFGRRVRYECRKRIATTRPRVNGRFAKKTDVDTTKAKATA